MLDKQALQTRMRPVADTMHSLGIAFLILGVIALVFPMVSTLRVVLYIGGVLLVSGAFLLVAAFSVHDTTSFFGASLLSILSIAIGIFLLFNPLNGSVALTLVVGIIFAIQAAFELFVALEMRPCGGSGFMTMSAITSALIALLIVAGWPGGVSQVGLGVLLGANYMTSGLGYIALSHALNRAALRAKLTGHP